jgi:hypothetical protein
MAHMGTVEIFEALADLTTALGILRLNRIWFQTCLSWRAEGSKFCRMMALRVLSGFGAEGSIGGCSWTGLVSGGC